MALETPEEKNFVVNLGKRIRAERIAQQRTLDEISVRCGLSKSTLSEIENGKRDIRISTLFRIATALRVSFDSLLADESPASQSSGGGKGYDFGGLF